MAALSYPLPTPFNLSQVGQYTCLFHSTSRK